MSRGGARTRKWNKNFDAAPYVALLEGTPIQEGRGMCRLADGRIVTVYPGRVGKVTVYVSDMKNGGRTARRTFGVHEHDAIREWTFNGELESEEQAKRLRAAAFEMYDALKVAAKALEQQLDYDLDPPPALGVVRTALAKAEGK